MFTVLFFFLIAVTLAVTRMRQTGTSSEALPGIPTASADLSHHQAMLSVSVDQRVDSPGGCGSLSPQLDHTGSRGWERSSASGTCAVSACSVRFLV